MEDISRPLICPPSVIRNPHSIIDFPLRQDQRHDNGADDEADDANDAGVDDARLRRRRFPLRHVGVAVSARQPALSALDERGDAERHAQHRRHHGRPHVIGRLFFRDYGAFLELLVGLLAAFRRRLMRRNGIFRGWGLLLRRAAIILLLLQLL